MKKQDISIMSFDGAWLAGTLSIPENCQALMIPVHGGLIQNRDGNLDDLRNWMFPAGVEKRNLFSDIKNYLSEHSVGSFCYDKRASGISEGIFSQTDLETLSKDVVAVSQYFKKEFPGLPLVLMGQSEGCLTIPLAKKMGASCDLMILQAPILQPIEEVTHFQKSHAAIPFLEDKTKEISKRFPLLSGFYNAVFNGEFFDKVKNTEDKLFSIEHDGKEYQINLDLYRQYDNCKTKEWVKEFNCPVSFLIGEKDLNTPASAVSEWRDSKEFDEHQHIEFHILEDLEHSFREFKADENFVDAMKKPISEKYFECLTDILNRRLGV